MQRRQCLALGVWLASRGGIAAVGLGLAAVGTVVAVAMAAAGHAPARVPLWTAQGVAWGAGVTIAFGGALRAFRRDLDQGVLVLARARGITLARYAQGRVGGLVVLLAAAVAGPTIVAGLAAASLTHPALPALKATAGGLAYGLGFAATLGPVAMATLGARTMAGGYMGLLAVVALPEILAPWTARLLPRGWHELTSIPAALETLAAGIGGGDDAVHFARALTGLAALVAASLLVIAARMPDVHASGTRRAGGGEA
jgi:hypothetical protein